MLYTLPDLWRLYRPGEVSADVVAAAAARRTPLKTLLVLGPLLWATQSA